MKKVLLIALLWLCAPTFSYAQCSVCTRTAAQLGEKPARGLNAGILYLAAAPLSIAGLLGYFWYRKNKGSV